MLDKAQSEEVEVRGPVDHDVATRRPRSDPGGFVRSVYMRDPNGYIVELTANTGVHQDTMDPAISKPRDALARWQAVKAGHGHEDQGVRT